MEFYLILFLILISQVCVGFLLGAYLDRRKNKEKEKNGE